MKKVKKLFVAVLAAAMVLCLVGGALADGVTYTVTVDAPIEGHSYEAYQIFSGTYYAVSSETGISNIEWGGGVDTAAEGFNAKFGAAKDSAKSLELAGTAETFADDIAHYLKSTSGTYTYDVGTGKGKISGLAAGYYLIRDVYNGAEGLYTDYIVEVVGNVTVKPKTTGVPTVQKKLKDINDSAETALSAWQDTADHDIGDVVPYRLTATLPADLKSYHVYELEFHDVMESGLTFDAASVKVYLDNKLITSGYTLKTTGITDGDTFEVYFADVLSLADVNNSSVISVEFNAKLNENANLGEIGNKNTVHLTYSTNPAYIPAVAEIPAVTDPNDASRIITPAVPAVPAVGVATYGKSVDDTVVVYTYKFVINKVDANNNKLPGASFDVYKFDKSSGQWEKLDVVATNEGGSVVTYTNAVTFTVTGMDDGIYKVVEATTPAGYDTVSPFYFKVEATHTQDDAELVLTELKATACDANGNALVTPDYIYSAVKENGKIAGVSVTVVNTKGSVLPTTGGVGTTVFYAVGSALILTSAVLLVLRKKVTF